MADYDMDREIEEGLRRSEAMLRRQRVMWVVGILGLMGVLLGCFAVVALVAYFYGVQGVASDPTPLPVVIEITSTPVPVTATPVPEPLPSFTPSLTMDEINAVAPYQIRFSAGRDGVTADCQAATLGNTFSQEDIFRNEWFYAAWPHNDEFNQKSPVWSVFTENNSFMYENQALNPDPDQDNCGWQGFSLAGAAVGDYIFEIKVDTEVVYRVVFHVTYSDLSQIPRPDRPPFGEFTFGRESVDTSTCQVSKPTDSIYVSDLATDQWFYFASPFQLGEIGQKLTWSIYRSDGSTVFENMERTVDDNIDLCWWQGFPMDGQGAGTYTLRINPQNGKEVVMEFYLK